VARCECPRGTVINEKTNTCVAKDECPSAGTQILQEKLGRQLDITYYAYN